MLKQIRLRVTEAVDRLLDIANHEELVPWTGQRLDNSVLNAGDILAFVHINVFVLSQQLIALIRIRHDSVCDLLHVRVVNRSGFQLLLFVLLCRFRDNQLKSPKLPLNHSVGLIVLLIQHGLQPLGSGDKNTLGALHLVPDIVKGILPRFRVIVQPARSRSLVKAFGC